MMNKGGRSGLTSRLVDPSLQPVVIVKDEVAARHSIFYKHCCHCTALHVALIHGIEVDVGQDVGIVHKEWLITVEEMFCLEYSATGVEQHVTLVADVDVKSKIIVVLKKFNNFLAKVVDVDGDVVKACRSELGNHTLKHCLAANLHEGLGAVVG